MRQFDTAECPLWVDAVEKVRDIPAERNNRIREVDFLNRTCAYDTRLESILLADPPENPFSTASVNSTLGLLRARRERPCGCCAAEERNELAPF
jgi:hypothetical protein